MDNRTIIEITPFENVIIQKTPFDNIVIVVPGEGVSGIFDESFDESYQ